MKKILLIAGARPNFMKIAPIVRVLQRRTDRFLFRIVHTGQHYDRMMSEVFFEELGIPQPDHHLEAGGSTHAEQTARIMVAFEKVCAAERPDLVLVVGDVNSTLACSIVAKKQHVPVAHVEAGLRSGDLQMPEEINRIVTDSITDHFFVTEKSGIENLLEEGKRADAIHFVGHVMIDNLFHQVTKLEGQMPETREGWALKSRYSRYGVVTLHRPSNVDHPDILRRIVAALATIAKSLPLIFPVHPRTRGNLARFDIKLPDGLLVTDPLSYMAFLNLFKDAALVLTDSGGLQEETTALGVPCLTLRENTERPITITEGTNRLVGTSPELIVSEAHKILEGRSGMGGRPSLWDGRAAERIVEILDVQLSAPATVEYRS